MLLVPLLLLSVAPPAQKTWKPPYAVLDKPTDADLYAQRLEKTGRNVFLDGGLLTFVYRSKAESVQLVNMMEMKLQRVEGTDLWIAQATMESWKGAFFSYSFVEGGLKRGMRLDLKTFRAPGAPEQPFATKKLLGTVETYTFRSEALGEDRSVTVYLPPGAPKGIPAVYITDGAGCRGFAEVLEPLILAKRVRPVAIVGVHDGGFRGEPGNYDPAKDFRAKEYLKMVDAERYAQHLRYFCDEVVPWAEAKFGLSSKRSDRAVEGYSNGGAFVTTATADRPEVFGNAMAYSVAAFEPEALKTAVARKDLPRMFFTAGTLEIFVRGTTEAYGIVKSQGARASFSTYKSGHDPAMWSLAFAKDVQTIFPSEQVPWGDEGKRRPWIGERVAQERAARDCRAPFALGSRAAGPLDP